MAYEPSLLVFRFMAKQIPIKNIGMNAVVDDDDFERVSNYKWTGRKRGYTFYATTTIPIEGYRRSMHQFILRLPHRTAIDHKDGNGLNNQKTNLRPATQQQNMRNMTRRKNSTGLPKGVRFNKSSKTFACRIRIGAREKRLYIRGFETARAAAIAYEILALKYFGEFAFTSVINSASSAEIETIKNHIEDQPPAKTKHRFFGITYRKSTKRWHAKIVIKDNEKRVHKFLGSFATDKDAAIAYNNAAILFVGSTAKLNPV